MAMLLKTLLVNDRAESTTEYAVVIGTLALGAIIVLVAIGGGGEGQRGPLK